MSPTTPRESSDAEERDWALYFGGPDKAPRRLRELLKSLIEAQPAGAAIDWVTYYFRDMDLAESLIAAADRGVRVRLLVESHTRSKGVNDAVMARLSEHGLGGGFRARPKRRLGRLAGHLHAKLYAFSHPRASVLIGSFNPSGNEPEDPRIIADIGDQDRGHNLLLRMFDPPLVEAAVAHARALWSERGAHPLRRLFPRENAVVHGAIGELLFFPRLDPRRALPSLAGANAVFGAVSHLKAGALTKALADFARRGGAARIVTHDTERRAPERVIADLKAAGVSIERYRHPQGLPMHAKFLVIEGDGLCARAGSLNDNPTSTWFNHEILFETRDPELCAALKRRFEEIL